MRRKAELRQSQSLKRLEDIVGSEIAEQIGSEGSSDEILEKMETAKVSS